MLFSNFIGRDVEIETFGGRRVRGRVVSVSRNAVVVRVRSRRRRRRAFVFVRTVQVSRVVVIVR
jgi:small nuclear ribonucleoprotein (snRNP)-like protein